MAINPDVSDLFFNFRHDARDRLYAEASPPGNVDPDAERAAIVEAAEEFAGMYGRATGVELDAEELADDYFARV